MSDFERGIREREARILQDECRELGADNAIAIVERMRRARDTLAMRPHLKFDMSVSITGLLTVVMAFGALVGGWYKFDYRVQAVENSVQTLQDEYKNGQENQKHIADALNGVLVIEGQLEQRMDDANVGSHIRK